MAKDYDVIIVGAGPAGLTAALYTGRAKLNTLVLDRMGPGGQLLNTELIEDYTGFKSITGAEMAQRFEEHAREFGAQLDYGTVTEIWSDRCWRYVRTEEESEPYRARAVIVCSGGEPRKLGAPGEKEFAGRGVSYCAICDGAFYKDEVLAVVGGGDSAVEEATFLTRYASKVYIIHRRDEFRATKLLQQRAFANPKIEVVWDSVVDRVGGTETVGWLEVRNVKTGATGRLDVGGVFIYVGFRPNSELFRDPVKLDPLGFIVTDEKMETSTIGVFAAGDVRSQFVRQITNAVGDATTAAVAVTRMLEAMGDECQETPEELERETEVALQATAEQYP
ncbi:MAG: thioredoxin-disulfide reductase [Chloroflexi bacterium]|nr:thioredoxin-disulfide reductase [Chloroflexota bacterium]